MDGDPGRRRVVRQLLAALLVATAGASFPGTTARAGPGIPGAKARIEGRFSQWPIPSGKMARNPVTDAQGRVYFAVEGADKLMRFDPATGAFTEWALALGTLPHFSVLGPDGKLLFAGKGVEAIGELDPLGGGLRQHAAIGGGGDAHPLLIDGNGDLWVAHVGGIARVRRGSREVTEFPMPGRIDSLVADRRGVVWVARAAADSVTSLDPATGRTTAVSMGAGAKPRRVDVAPDGAVWVTLYGLGKIAKIDPATSTVGKQYSTPGGANSGPFAVNVDARGRVWVSEYQTDAIVLFEPQIEKFRVFPLPQRNSGVRYATVDPNGRYWYIATRAGLLGAID